MTIREGRRRRMVGCPWSSLFDTRGRFGALDRQMANLLRLSIVQEGEIFCLTPWDRVPMFFFRNYIDLHQPHTALDRYCRRVRWSLRPNRRDEKQRSEPSQRSTRPA